MKAWDYFTRLNKLLNKVLEKKFIGEENKILRFIEQKEVNLREMSLRVGLNTDIIKNTLDNLKLVGNSYKRCEI